MDSVITAVRWTLWAAGVVMPLYLVYVFVRLFYLRHLDPKRHDHEWIE